MTVSMPSGDVGSEEGRDRRYINFQRNVLLLMGRSRERNCQVGVVSVGERWTKKAVGGQAGSGDSGADKARAGGSGITGQGQAQSKSRQHRQLSSNRTNDLSLPLFK
jgi:hypothetical protein